MQSEGTRVPRRPFRRRVVALLAAASMAAIPTVAAQAQGQGQGNGRGAGGAGESDPTTPALTTPFQLVDDRDVDDRLAQPEDRYALAGGCYTIEAPGQGHVAVGGDGLVLAPDPAQAEPFHFQATRLGQYLLATNEGPSQAHPDAWWDERGYLAAAGVLPEVPQDQLGLPLPGDGLADVERGSEPLKAPLPSLPTTDDVTVASEPGEAADWQVAAAGGDPDARTRGRKGQDYVLSLPSQGKALAVEGGALTLTDGTGEGFRFHHVPDDDPTDEDPNGTACATWPEVETNTSGAPADPKGNPAREVRGFFDAHIHGMAFEFLGGELRCGRPWHPYGVEHALPDCREDGQVLNPAAEVVLAGADPSSYDPVGWPTFASWPDHDLLTHEQFYWKWLERAYHGGLRMMTNLLVENTALCQIYPQKKNSCNEMDSVRLQAQRLFELQDYIDAQSGGPGEGWFRIVTSPAQARRVINDGRLAMVLGIEVSVLFDCGELMGEPQCTKEQLDQRITEIHDMGVRQVELINKFDNGLSGVTGDGGSTGLIVNQGNKFATGHYWDMRSCPEEADDGHDHGIEGTQYDKTQLNPSDDTPLGQAGGDVLAARIIDQFGVLTSTAAPVYGPGPHCNSRGLTELGEYAVRRIIDHGIIFDPDHMSAAGQRQALDLVENEIIPAEHRAAEQAGRAPRLPGLISSHSWANDVTYQRILHLGGQVAPMQAEASSFVDRWAQRREWADDLVPDDVLYGMGYGADTNGFASQPGPRPDPAQPLTYDGGWQAPLGDVTVYQQTSGMRTFDINTDGVAHYGLYADWYRELQLAADEEYPELGGGDAIMADMLKGPENFLQMWERATYGGNDCVTDHSSLQPEDLHALLGANLEGFLRAAGQPVDRDGAAYTYCVAGEDGTQAVDVVFDDDGRAQRVQGHEGDVRPDQTPTVTGAVGAGDGHAHGAPASVTAAGAAGAPLPATGGGAAGAGLLLVGLTFGGAGLFGRRRRAMD